MSNASRRSTGPTWRPLAISNQRETALVWERATGKPLGPCVVWQCHRSAAFCNELKERGLSPTLQERTGLQIDPMFSASKIRWLLDHIPDGQARAANGELCAGQHRCPAALESDRRQSPRHRYD